MDSLSRSAGRQVPKLDSGLPPRGGDPYSLGGVTLLISRLSFLAACYRLEGWTGLFVPAPNEANVVGNLLSSAGSGPGWPRAAPCNGPSSPSSALVAVGQAAARGKMTRGREMMQLQLMDFDCGGLLLIRMSLVGCCTYPRYPGVHPGWACRVGGLSDESSLFLTPSCSAGPCHCSSPRSAGLAAMAGWPAALRAAGSLDGNLGLSPRVVH